MEQVTNKTPLEAALRAVKRHLVWAAVFSALLNLLFIAPMLYMLQVYDRVVPTQGSFTLLFLTIVLIFALATLSMLEFVRSRLLVRASARLDRQLSGAILNATLARPEEGRSGISKQILREFDTLRQTLTGAGVIAVFDAPWTPIYILICFIIHPAIGFLALIGALLLVLVTWRNEKVTREPMQRANEAAGRAYTSHDLSAAKSGVVRALGMRNALVSRHLQEREAMVTLQTDASFASGWLVALAKFLRLLLQSAALGVGALLAIQNEISPGAIFASMFLVGRALAPIDQVLNAWKSMLQGRGAYNKLVQLFKAPADVSATQLPPPKGELRLEGLTVLNETRDRAIINNVSFAVKAGEVVGIIGPSGAGKSTLLNYIAGAAIPAQGQIRFDGAEQRDWDAERLARFIGYMPQEPSLFSGSIKDNISRFQAGTGGDQSGIDAAAVEAAQQAGAHDLILQLPSGYDHQLSWGGSGLSMGQAQRVALARAMFGSPSYLLLDEPNAHLDSEGDTQLIKSLAELKSKGVTILVVAHKLSILPVVDKLLLMRDGRLELFGPRDEVMRQIAPPQAPRAVPKAAG